MVLRAIASKAAVQTASALQLLVAQDSAALVQTVLLS
jgi:hypothetical protein